MTKRGPGETQQLVAAAYSEHPTWTSGEIGLATGVAPSNVRAILNKLRLRLAKARRPNLMDWERQAIVDAANEKMEALAAEFNCRPGCINDIWRRAGVSGRSARNRAGSDYMNERRTA